MATAFFRTCNILEFASKRGRKGEEKEMKIFFFANFEISVRNFWNHNESEFEKWKFGARVIDGTIFLILFSPAPPPIFVVSRDDLKDRWRELRAIGRIESPEVLWPCQACAHMHGFRKIFAWTCRVESRKCVLRWRPRFRRRCARGSHRPATCSLERKSHLFRFSSRRSLR